MTRKFMVWLDSGANIHSTREQTINLKDIGIEDDEWDTMTEEEKDKAMKEVAFDHAEWGYHEL